ncbi:MAG TPA: hypothetical protein ENK78_04750 [Thiothrix sp.]|nr:hypothetical protein [Thiothrix sp.]
MYKLTVSPLSYLLKTLLIGSCVSLVGCQDSSNNDSETVYSEQSETLYLEQGWTEANQYRNLSYNLAQGSQLIPYNWFLHLEEANSENLIRSDEVIASLRYLKGDGHSVYNPDNLPIGFVKDTDTQGKDWIGLTCAACHTGQINYKNTAIRIDGGQTLGDFIALLSTISASIESTQNDPAKFTRFAQHLYGDNALQHSEVLRNELAFYKTKVDGIIKRDRTTTTSGFGRLDAFGSIGNEIFVDDMQDENNFRQINAPVSYPFLWNTPSLERVQWTGNVENPLGRNIGEVIGVFGSVNLTDPNHLFETSAKVQNLVRLEGFYKSLTAPKWPEAILGALDPQKVAAGKSLYEAVDADGYACVSCHTLPDSNGVYPLTPAEDNLFGKQFIKTFNTPLDEIGTDRNAADIIYNPFFVSTGLLASVFEGQTTLPLTTVQGAVVGLTLRNALSAIQPPLSDAEQAAYNGFRFYAEGKQAEALFPAYKARPLNGIWATSPYLHNGSVRTLEELLKPAAQRETGFWVGSREFDPIAVGFQSTDDADHQFFDTYLSANSAAGHEYGTHLDAEQKSQLLEFLKSL